MRRRFFDPLLGAALFALVPLAGALADPAPPPPPAAPAGAPPAPAAPLTVTRPDPDRTARREARRATRLDADLDAAHAGLLLSVSQDKLWPPVAEAMRGLDEARGIRFRRTLAAADSQVDGLKMQGEHMAAMGVAMGKLADATKPLVASLTPEQKSRLPTLVQRMRPRKIVARAFDLPQDNASSWGTGQADQTRGGMRQGGAAGGPGMNAQGMGGPRANAPAAGVDRPDRDDDE